MKVLAEGEGVTEGEVVTEGEGVTEFSKDVKDRCWCCFMYDVCMMCV